MLRQEALFQSLAASGAVLITFVGVCHEVVGAQLFPWAPEVLGGPIGWHGLGIGTITIGLLLCVGTLRIIRFPVLQWALIIAVAALAVGIFTAIVHRQFHLFAFALVLAATGMAVGHRKTSHLIALTEE
jgi:hypothetical protein